MLRAVDPADLPVITGEVLVHEDEGEAFLLHVPSGHYFGLNPAGLVIWRAIEACTDPVDALRQRWPDTPVEVCRNDVAALLAELSDAGLVRLPDASPPSDH